MINVAGTVALAGVAIEVHASLAPNTCDHRGVNEEKCYCKPQLLVLTTQEQAWPAWADTYRVHLHSFDRCAIEACDADGGIIFVQNLAH